MAALIGLVVFVILWLTSARPRFFGTPGEDASASSPAAPAPTSKEAIIEAALPRGGSLIGFTDSPALAVGQLTGAPLARVNRSTDELEPWLAESWAAAEGNLIYTVKLRPGLTSADGTPLTGALAAQALGQMTAAGQPVGVRVLDPLTLEIRFASAFAPALRLLDRHPVPGFGPFVEDNAASKKSGLRTFKRNERYWRKAADGSSLPYLDELVLAAAPERPGQHDFADAAVPADEIEELKKIEQSGKARLFELGPGLDADALWFSPAPPRAEERPWLTSEALRLAITTAVTRREYCKQVFYGACDPVAGPVSPANLAWFNPDLPLGQANPDLARTKLAELGLRDRNGDGLLDDAMRKPLRFTLLIRRDVPSAARAATFLTGVLKSIGVLMDVTPLPADALAARRQKGNYDAMYDRIEMGDTDPAMNLDFWSSSGAAHVWRARTSPPADWERQLDGLLMKSATTFDRVERLQAFVDAQKLYLQHMPAIFFGVPHIRIATSMKTLNATPSPVRPHLLWNAESLAALKQAQYSSPAPP